jgi:hypothetical protein
MTDRREFEEQEETITDQTEVPREWRPDPATIKAIEAPSSSSSSIRDHGKVSDTIEVTGFEASGVISDKDVREYLDRLPQEHLDGLTEIRYTDTFQGDSSGVVLGEWRKVAPGKAEILIHRQDPSGSSSRGKLEDTLTHEVGHNAFNNLDEGSRQEWESIFEKTPKDSFVSTYAETNPNEDFAESYEVFSKRPDYLREYWPERYEFMSTKVFRN